MKLMHHQTFSSDIAYDTYGYSGSNIGSNILTFFYMLFDIVLGYFISLRMSLSS